MSAPITQSPHAPWRMMGNVRDCEFLDVDDVLQIHVALSDHAAGTDDAISPPGVKDKALLESAVARPRTSYGGELKYRSAEDAAAALMHSIVLNHPFFNGNKRTALVATLVFLDRNNFIVETSEDDLYDLVTAVAAHELVPDVVGGAQRADLEVMLIAQRLGKRSRQTVREERPITKQKLARRLRDLGCSLDEDGDQWLVRRGARTGRDAAGRPAQVVLEHRMRVPAAGKDVGKTNLKMLRRQLHLDAEHLVDADRFYSASNVASDYIAEYSTLLRRLAET